MANLTRGTSIGIDDTVTAGTLHDLIESALISNLGPSDLNAGNFFIAVSNTTPNPSLNPIWYNPDREDPLLRIFATPFDIWLAVGPDRFEIPMLNSSGTLCPKGALVIAGSGASLFDIAVSPSLNALGFLQADTAAGAWGPVATCGIGWSLHFSSPSLSSQQVPATSLGIKAYGCPAGGVGGEGLGGNGGSGPFFGLWLQGNRSGASGHGSIHQTLIWGPKLTINL